jgi:hypothetical protein
MQAEPLNPVGTLNVVNLVRQFVRFAKPLKAGLEERAKNILNQSYAGFGLAQPIQNNGRRNLYQLPVIPNGAILDCAEDAGAPTSRLNKQPPDGRVAGQAANNGVEFDLTFHFINVIRVNLNAYKINPAFNKKPTVEKIATAVTSFPNVTPNKIAAIRLS